jgi:uncharacterized protein YacL
MKLKDIIAVIIALMLSAILGYLAFTIQDWWEWVFIVAIVALMGLQARDYILYR